jgi:3-methyladenine DNA glycosylase AlkD
MSAKKIAKELKIFADPKKAKVLQGFFKTAPGEYGAGDVFLGVTSVRQRLIARRYPDIGFSELRKLLGSKIHEFRQIALIILVEKFSKADKEKRKKIFDFYLSHTSAVNNWDLVDISCRAVIGGYLFDKDRKILYKLARSKDLWERRIAIISTAYFISKKQYRDTFRIAKILLRDKHDLIHKAVGWMLREVGKNCGKAVEEVFLRKYYKAMPRTMLRYALEKFSAKKRHYYLKK